MGKLADRVNRPEFQKAVNQYRVVLDFITDLENEMRRQELKKSELAENLGKTRSWISKVFRKKPNLTFFTAVELADALGMEVHVRAVPKYLRALHFSVEQEPLHVIGAINPGSIKEYSSKRVTLAQA